MPEYQVRWDIELTADSPREAAEQALRMQRDPSGWATVFTVTDGSDPTPGTNVDLG
jgi:hypothetical protein